MAARYTCWLNPAPRQPARALTLSLAFLSAEASVDVRKVVEANLPVSSKRLLCMRCECSHPNALIAFSQALGFSLAGPWSLTFKFLNRPSLEASSCPCLQRAF
jgi:hypothetical protein